MALAVDDEFQITELNMYCTFLSGRNDIKKRTPTLAFKKTCATPSEKANEARYRQRKPR